MQDYPQHLFLSYVTATYDDPSVNCRLFYQVNLAFRPYMLWYLCMKPLALLFSVETAGKMIFSVYILLITALVIAAANRSAERSVQPWGALLFYPFAFNQMYFMGFTNYVMSLPILFIALQDLEKHARQALPAWRLALHALFILLLLINHPFTLLVYIALAGSASIFSLRDLKSAPKTLIPAVFAGLVFIVYYVAEHGPSSAPLASSWEISWWNIRGTLGYYLLMFTGMRLTTSVDWIVVFLWSICAAIFLRSWRRNKVALEDIRWPCSLFVASLAGFVILPFWFGYYSYFNLRLAPVSYFALALVLSRLQISRQAGIKVAVCSMLLILLSIRTQAKISCEAETILPVLAKMKKNSLVLPVIFDGSSENLDPVYFYQVHTHEAYYYHIVRGGGANPTIFPNAMMPVQYRPGFSPLPPGEPAKFSVQRYKPFYDYFLVRSSPQGFKETMFSNGCTLSASSGHWQLFSKRSGVDDRQLP